jgi:hypothetical protein
MRSSHDCHREGFAESDNDNSLSSSISNKLADIASSVTTADQSTDMGDPQADDSWEICNIISKRTIDGVVPYWVDWDSTWMCESELKVARESIEESETRLRRRNKKGKREIDAVGKAQPKRPRGQPGKRS